MVFEANQRESGPRFLGLHVGQVMDVSSYATSGQIQVIVPSIFDPPTPDNWVSAKLCFLYGHFFMPVVGDLVWLAFENGDPRSPVCLGIFYPPGQFPPEAAIPPLPTSPIQSGVIKTAAGHLIDLKGDGSIVIQANNLVTTIELTAEGVTINGGIVNVNGANGGIVNVNGATVNLGQQQPKFPVLRQFDQGIGNLGAPVPLSTILPPTRTVFV